MGNTLDNFFLKRELKQNKELKRVKELFKEVGKHYSYSRSEVNSLRYLKLI